MKAFNDFKTRGAAHILIAVTERPKGHARSAAAVFPASTLLAYIVRLIRNSLATPVGKTTRHWQQRSNRSVLHPVPKPHCPNSMCLSKGREARSFRSWQPPGDRHRAK
ncbi:hypothetical protein [Pseudomonas aeruginosa]|uniref:hypothetical protein n=1 Tax=Pseudomonas aeruginosa TaxID=287 RepID=UPI003FD02299